MQFIYETNADQAAAALAERLHVELEAGKPVVWFVSGGSNISLAVQVMDSMSEELSQKLTILLLDERFGKPGHADSNWKQLQDAGFNPKKAKTIETLQPEKTLLATCTAYDDAVHNVIGQAEKNGGIVIAQCGIGGDGHIAGILPHSSAVTASEWVTCYDGGAYQRITITPIAWEHLDVAFAFAYGDGKQGTLTRLKNDALSVNDQPSQLLKVTPEAYVYTDQEV
jgi:6-phosphogluconolactonase/glucosamine-6-phosphate isomerase/deaminase